MITHEDAASSCRDISEPTDLDLDAGCAHACVCNPHRDAIEQADISNQKRVGDANDPGDWAESEIDKDELQGWEHSIFKDTVSATRPMTCQRLYLLLIRAAIAAGSFW